jgi:hypothetical protein
MLVVLASCGSGEGRPARAPAAVKSIVRAFAIADADGQALATGEQDRWSSKRYLRRLVTDPKSLSATASGGRAAAAIIQRQSSAAQYTERVSGFARDAADASVSALKATRQAANRLQLTATITELFHIRGGAATGPLSGSGASDPYEFTFVRSPNGTWLLANVVHEGPWD